MATGMLQTDEVLKQRLQEAKVVCQRQQALQQRDGHCVTAEDPQNNEGPVPHLDGAEAQSALASAAH